MGTLSMPGVWGMWFSLGDNCLLTSADPGASLPSLGTHLLGLQAATAPDIS